MSVIFKISLGLYVLAVLAFSSVSRAETESFSRTYTSPATTNMVFVSGTLDWFDGFLFFTSHDGQTYQVTENCYDIFGEGTDFPLQVELWAASVTSDNKSDIPLLYIVDFLISSSLSPAL